VAGAVAAPDGSAIFAINGATSGDAPDPAGAVDPAIEANALIRVDPRTGRRLGATGEHGDGWWHVKHPGRVAAVAPGGERVVLVASEVGGAPIRIGGQPATRVMIWDTTARALAAVADFGGVLEPEAISTDGSRVFAARSFGDHYQITTLFLPSGDQQAIGPAKSAPTSGRDEDQPPEDMYGDVVQAVLTPDRRALATLYRDERSDAHTAFVHLLDLEQGVTVCIDLTAPFGTGAAGTDAIRANPDGTIEVGHRDSGATGGVTASFDPAAILAGPVQQHYHADVRSDPNPPAVPDGVAATPGFERFVALAQSGS
jgi:hypothetical protein